MGKDCCKKGDKSDKGCCKKDFCKCAGNDNHKHHHGHGHHHGKHVAPKTDCCVPKAPGKCGPGGC